MVSEGWLSTLANTISPPTANFPLNVTNCTFAAPSSSAPGISLSQPSSTTLNNTILGMTMGSDIVNTGGTLTGGYNVIPDSTYAIAGLTNTVHANPALNPLSSNGGPTQTMAPQGAGINQGNNALVPAGVSTDQSGHIRISNGTVVIGAYEVQSPALNSIAVTPTSSSNPELASGVAAQFTATGTFANGATVNLSNSVIWESATPTVATIGGTGLAQAPGTTVITAWLDGVESAAVTLTVLAPSFVVNTTQDVSGFYTGVTSLRQAIAEASAVASGQTVTFDTTVFATAQTITLTAGPLTPSNKSGKLTIKDTAAGGVTISGNGISGAFIVNAGQNVELDNLVITGGVASTGGGVQSNKGTLTFNNDAFTGNNANGAASQAPWEVPLTRPAGRSLSSVARSLRTRPRAPMPAPWEAPFT